MNSYARNIIVGIIVILGIAVFVEGGMWLRGRVLRRPDVEVMFEDIGNLKEGAPVRVSGAQVGRVTEIEFRGAKHVRAGLILDQAVHPTKSAKVTIVAIGMLGDAMINLDPGTGAPLMPGDTLKGSIEVGIFDKAGALTDKASETMTSLNAMLDRELIVQLKHTLKTSEQMLTYLLDEKKGPTAEVNTTMRAMQSTMAHLDTTIASFDVKKLEGGLDSTLRSSRVMMSQLTSTTARMDTLMSKIQHGEGTMGKLATDSTLYNDLRTMLKSLTEFVDDLKKHPGKIAIQVRMP